MTILRGISEDLASVYWTTGSNEVPCSSVALLVVKNSTLSFFIFLADLSARVDAVKEENLKLKSENQVLGQYIENLMSASSVFQTAETKSKRKWGPLRVTAEAEGLQLRKEIHFGGIRRGLFSQQAKEFSATVRARLPESKLTM